MRAARVVAASAALLAGVALSVHAATYPERAVRLVVPFAPGGSTDVLARIMAQQLADAVGQPVIADNRAAAGGTVGSDIVAKAPPDGYTLMVGSIATTAIAGAMYPNLPYDPLRDFAHIGLWVTFPLALVVQPGSPAASTKDLIELARAKPGTLRFGSQGLGTSSHVFAELMNRKAGMQVVIVPYRGGAPAMNGLLAGEVDYALVAVSTALSQVAVGKLRALGVTSAQPTPSLPNVPPIAAVLPGYDALNFHGLHAPARTPAAIVARLNGESISILRRPGVVERLRALAMDVVAGTPAQYQAFIKAQIEQWTPVITAAGTRPQ